MPNNVPLHITHYYILHITVHYEGGEKDVNISLLHLLNSRH